MELGNQLMLTGFAIAGCAFIAVLSLYFRLRHYVATEKLHALEDVSQLWKYGVPPKIALNEKGLRLYRYMRMAATLFFIGIGVVFAGIFAYGIPYSEQVG